ncbi:DUF4035 domain-containing protein [Actinobacillus equuli subsp. haemolyticus]|nr:DUF4035 domain-containing protein [Actinobacillus equuli subsp. haemolyticus]
MPESHLDEYQLFYQEQPFGLWRDDYRSAQIAHMLAVVNSTKESRPALNDFMLFFNQGHNENNDDGVADYLATR